MQTPKSASPANRSPKDKTPKVFERRSSQSPVTTEKKWPGKVSELESEITRLQNDLKMAKDQLSYFESWKQKAQEEAQEANNRFLAMAAKLEESEQNLLELSAVENDRVQELWKLSQDRDRAWEYELQAVHKQHSMDCSVLASAIKEIKKLKKQLGEMDESARNEYIENFESKIEEYVFLVEKMKSEINDCKESEAKALEILRKTNLELELAKENAEKYRLKVLKVVGDYNSLASELDKSKIRVNLLEDMVKKLQDNEENEVVKELKFELNYAKYEVGQLRTALDDAETRYEEEYAKMMLQIQRANENFERTKMESCKREAELEEELKNTKAYIEVLKENEGFKEKIQLSDEESTLEIADFVDFEEEMLDQEIKLQRNSTENEGFKEKSDEESKLKIELTKTEDEFEDFKDTVMAKTEQEALMMKISQLTNEAEENNKRAERIAEQLDATLAANAEMAAELQREKVQVNQWRKAAEAAAAILSKENGKNGKFVLEKTGSLKNDNFLKGVVNVEEFEKDDDDDETSKNKNRNVLRKIGGLWKKVQK